MCHLFLFPLVRVTCTAATMLYNNLRINLIYHMIFHTVYGKEDVKKGKFLNWTLCVPYILPADAVPIAGIPDRATDTSQIPSLWPTYSLKMPQLNWGALKLDTILLVWAFNLWAVLLFCDDELTKKQTRISINMQGKQDKNIVTFLG